MLKPFNFKKWIDDHRDQLKPPVGNKQVFKDSTFIVMIIGGPNERQDFHINQTDEWFYQLEGDMVLKIREKSGEFMDVPIREGECFMLPGGIPHSPQRSAESIGLVVEKTRVPTEKDTFVWYCENDDCHDVLYKDTFFLEDIEGQLPATFNKYWSDPENYTCKKCGRVNAKLGTKNA